MQDIVLSSRRGDRVKGSGGRGGVGARLGRKEGGEDMAAVASPKKKERPSFEKDSTSNSDFIWYMY
jgi:hypothetical protein